MDKKSLKKGKKNVIEEKPTSVNFLFVVGNNILTEKYYYTCNITVGGSTHLNLLSSGFSVYINNDYYGDDVSEIQINNGDVLKIIVNKQDPNLESNIELFINYI